jgi:hypothetical protein
MKKSLLLIGIVAWVACQQACYEDKGHYDYLSANKVSITMPASTLNATLGDTLYYTPTLTFANPSDMTGFEYWWEYKGNMGLHPHHEVICEGLELRFVPRIVGPQDVQLCVKELSSGTITTASMTVNGGSIYTKGWLILREENGETKLSYIRPDRAVPGNTRSERVYVPYIDIYGLLSRGESLGSGPIVVRQGYSYSGNIIYVIQENESVCLNGISYAKEIRLAQEFIGGAPTGLAPHDYYQGNYSSMVLNVDGKAYYRCVTYGSNTAFFTYSFANFPMEYEGKVLKIEQIVPSIAERAYYFVLYDKENKRFLWIYAGQATTGGSPLLAEITTSESEYLDYNNLGDAEIIYSAFYRQVAVGFGGEARNITLYAKGGNVYVQRCRGEGEQLASEVFTQPIDEVQHSTFSGQPYISPESKYYQLQTRDYLFFATSNRLYWYDHLAKTTRLFYTFPAGANVVDMNSNPQESELGVALSNGTFITLNIENDRLMDDNNKIYEIALPGRIVDLEYKFPNSTAYTNRTSNPD